MLRKIIFIMILKTRVFGIECLEEMARIVDQRTLKANGKIVPVQEIDGKILFDVDVASAHEGKDKEGTLRNSLAKCRRGRYSSGVRFSNIS